MVPAMITSARIARGAGEAVCDSLVLLRSWEVGKRGEEPVALRRRATACLACAGAEGSRAVGWLRTRGLLHLPVANGVQGPAKAHDVAYLHARRREQLVRWHNADCQEPQSPQMTLIEKPPALEC